MRKLLNLKRFSLSHERVIGGEEAVSNAHQEIMRRRRTTQDESCCSIADLFPSRERLSEEPKNCRAEKSERPCVNFM